MMLMPGLLNMFLGLSFHHELTNAVSLEATGKQFSHGGYKSVEAQCVCECIKRKNRTIGIWNGKGVETSPQRILGSNFMYYASFGQH